MATAIIPIIMPAKQTMAAANQLLHHGWGVFPLAPPSVPATSFRLRLFVRASHRHIDLDDLVEALMHATGIGSNN